MIAVDLTQSEAKLAADVGVMRQLTAMRDGRSAAYGCPPDFAWQFHIVGAFGELATAKHFKVYWNGTVGRVDTADVGPLQVRASTRSNSGVILHPFNPQSGRGDRDEDIFIGARVDHSYRRVLLVGYIKGVDGKVDKNWRETDRPAFFVEPLDLKPIWELAGYPFKRSEAG